MISYCRRVFGYYLNFDKVVDFDSRIFESKCSYSFNPRRDRQKVKVPKQISFSYSRIIINSERVRYP